MTSKRFILYAALWLIAFATALFFDRAVAEQMHARGYDNKIIWTQRHIDITEAIKSPGEYFFTVIIAVLLLLFHRTHWRAGGFVALAGGVCAMNGILKWVVGRQRPITGIAPFDFNFFTGGLHGLFNARNLCFPSGHACMAFTTATAVGICLPRWRPIFFAVAAVVGCERIYENAHYLSDVVAGAGLGWFSAHATHWILERLVQRRALAGLKVGVPFSPRPRGPAMTDAVRRRHTAAERDNDAQTPLSNTPSDPGSLAASDDRARATSPRL